MNIVYCHTTAGLAVSRTEPVTLWRVSPWPFHSMHLRVHTVRIHSYIKLDSCANRCRPRRLQSMNVLSIEGQLSRFEDSHIGTS